MPEHENAPLMQIPTPHPALKRLGKLIGEWKLTGRTLNANADNISGWSRFEWLPGGFFVQNTGQLNFMGTNIESVEMIWYDPTTDTFPSTVYSNLSTEPASYHWNVEGNTVTHWEGTSKYTGTLSDDGKTLVGGWRPNQGEASSEENAYDAVMTRVA